MKRCVRCGQGKECVGGLKQDVLILPVSNVTLEELAAAFLDKVNAFRSASRHEQILEIVVRVFSGPGQSASARWTANDLHRQGG